MIRVEGSAEYDDEVAGTDDHPGYVVRRRNGGGVFVGDAIAVLGAVGAGADIVLASNGQLRCQAAARC